MKRMVKILILCICTLAMTVNCATITQWTEKIVGSQQQQVDITAALNMGVEEAFKNVSPNSNIAIVHISATPQTLHDFITGELEHILVGRGMTIVDRQELNRVREEQNLQLSGDVDENTAISIGKFAGADAIVIGRVDGEGTLRRLRLRVLGTQTAHVLGTASEQFITTRDITDRPPTKPEEVDVKASQILNITSNPSAADIQIYDQNRNVVYFGRTPATPSLNTFVNTNYLVTISKDGYVNAEYNIRAANNNLSPNAIAAALTRIPDNEPKAPKPKRSISFPRFALYGGLSMTDFVEENREYEMKADHRNGGISVWTHITLPIFVDEIGARYISKGAKESIPSTTVGTFDIEHSLQYIECFYKLKLNIGFLRLYPYLGYSAALLLSAEEKYDDNDPIDVSKLYNTLDYGFLYGVDYAITKGIFIGFEHNLGTANVLKDKDRKATNNMMLFRIGFLL